MDNGVFTALISVASVALGVTLKIAYDVWAKRKDGKQQNKLLAMRLTEMKHQQLVAAQEWAIKDGRPSDVDFWDPLMSLIEYQHGLEEFDRTGGWTKGQMGLEIARERAAIERRGPTPAEIDNAIRSAFDRLQSTETEPRSKTLLGDARNELKKRGLHV